MKEQIIKAIDDCRGEVIALSHAIHANPELRFKEFKAAKLQTELLKQHGFTVEMPYASLDTAYKAVFKGKGEGSCVAFLAEYDALEKMGHGCGHNLIASMSVGAAIGLASAMGDIPGEIVVMGCPGEEGGKGKVVMLNENGFDGIDFAMMIHPSQRNLIGRGGLAACVLEIVFHGKSAHSKEPYEGVNALTALIKTFTAIDTLRQCWKEDVKINGIITAGGVAPNIIPDYAAAKFTARAKTIAALQGMMDDVRRAAESSAALVGAQLEFKPGLISSERYPNAVMGQVMKENMARLGVEMTLPPPNLAVGSSDFGNVSMVIPSIHEYLAVTTPKIKNHTPEFTEVAKSPEADEVTIKGAKGLAMTAFDILNDGALRDRIVAEFQATVPRPAGKE